MSKEIQKDPQIVEKSQSDSCIKISVQALQEPEDLLVENRGEGEDIELQKDINGILLQYMESLNLEKSYREFVKEAREMKLPLHEGVKETLDDIDIPAPFSKEDGYQLLDDFENDNSESIINLWDRFLTGINLKHQEDFKKLTFFVRIYAAIIPFKSVESTETERAKSMSSLHKFFLDKSNEILTDDTMLSLFALPFIPDPKVHPLFSTLFQPNWKEKLRSQLTIAVEKYVEITKLSTSAEDSDLYKMFKFCLGKSAESLALKQGHGPAASDPAEMEGLQNEIFEFEDRYYKLLKVTTEVVDTLDKYVKGKLEDMSLLRQRIHQLYPELFTGAVDGGEEISQKMDEIVINSSRKQNPRPSTTTRRKPVIACRSKSKYRQNQQNQRVILQRSRTYVVRKSASHTPKPSGRDLSPAIRIANEQVDDEQQHGDYSLEASISQSSLGPGLTSPKIPRTPIKIIHGSSSVGPSSSRSKIPIAIKSTSAIKSARSPHPLNSQAQQQQLNGKPTLTQSASLTLQSSHPPVENPKPRFCHSQGMPSKNQPKSVCKKSRVPLLKKGSRTNIHGSCLNGNQLQTQGVNNGSNRARSADDYFIEERSQQSQPNTTGCFQNQKPPAEWIYNESSRPATAYETRSNSDFEVVLSPRRKPARKRE